MIKSNFVRKSYREDISEIVSSLLIQLSEVEIKLRIIQDEITNKPINENLTDFSELVGSPTKATDFICELTTICNHFIRLADELNIDLESTLKVLLEQHKNLRLIGASVDIETEEVKDNV
jgi:dimeric dUTPase (all-alpha-NTP-PPase superfamily)